MKKELLDQHNAQADQLGISNLFLRQLPSISNELLRILLVLAHFDQRFGHHPDFDGNITPSLLEQMTGLNLHSVIRGLDEGIKAVSLHSKEEMDLTLIVRIGKESVST